MTDVVDAEVVAGTAVLRCSLCSRPTADGGLIGKQCRDGTPPCRGRMVGEPPTVGVVARVAGVIAERRDDYRHSPASAPDERPLTASAMGLVMKGIPAKTQETYENQWNRFSAWCEVQQLAARPAAQSTMIQYLDEWRPLPVHNRCAGGRQEDGTPCTGHRPSPSTMWAWYSAVRFYHSMPEPPFAWYGGKRLAIAMKGYAKELTEDLGWTPNRAPRAYPEHVMAMVDALDLTDPRAVRDRAVILLGWYTAARASDVGTYRIADVEITPRDVAKLTLRSSKTNTDVGLKTELRVLHPNPLAAYDPVTAVEAWIAMMRDRWNVRQGALFRPLTKPGPKSGLPALLRGARDATGYRMSSVSISEIITDRAVDAGIPTGEYFTMHSLRRGRASHLRELGYDRLSIARSFGWAPNGSINTYMEEAEAESKESPTAGGLLGMTATAKGTADEVAR